MSVGLLSVLAAGVAVEVKAEERSPLAPLFKGGTNPEVPLIKGDLGESKLAEQPTISRLRDFKQPATTVKQWIAQMEAATVQVTNIRLERTDTGLEITLETAAGKPLQVDASKFRSEGNRLIADIPNAVLALPGTQEFSAANPTADIANLQVVQRDASSIRISVTGNNALPKTEVTLKTGGLAYSLNPEAEEPDEEIVVTGERDGYRVPNTSVGTRTDTPLRDIPQSIQVVPQQVIRDQQATRLEDALKNVPSVTQGFGFYSSSSAFTIRGFSVGSESILRDGLPDPSGGSLTELSNIERIEVLKGPASVLNGFGNPGGTINIVTKQPLRDPFYGVEGTIGNYDFYRGAVDLTGSLNDSRTVLYRLNTAYENSGSFIDFFDKEYFGISPVLSFAIGERTKLFLEGEYVKLDTGWYPGLPIRGTILSNPNGEISRNRNFGEPSDSIEQTVGRVGYRLEHQFSENWLLRNAFRAAFKTYDEDLVVPTSLRADNRTLNRTNSVGSSDEEDYILTTNFIGKFSTGSIQHQLLAGIDLGRTHVRFLRDSGGTAAPIDVFNPVYGQLRILPTTRQFDIDSERDSLGIYVQDQVTLAENLKLLLGVRFDTFEQRNQNFLSSTRINQTGDAFSPRVGIVYQPIPAISLYASYARSFTPVIGNAFDGSIFQPERGTQYEVGLKADLNDRLSATLAFYDLTRSNVLTADPAPGRVGFSIQTGEQRSRGFELNIAGEILPGWNIIAGYAYTDARIAQDNSLPVDNRLNNVPENAFNLWTTYQIQRGPWQGFGVGAGFFFVGERQGNLANTFELPSYFRTDAAIFYERDRFRAALNFSNIFDVEYFESGITPVRVNAGRPFTVRGTISWQF